MIVHADQRPPRLYLVLLLLFSPRPTKHLLFSSRPPISRTSISMRTSILSVYGSSGTLWRQRPACGGKASKASDNCLTPTRASHRIKGNPVLVPKVLEVEKSQLCYIVGTVYMDMPLKPNVMEDIARDVSVFLYFLQPKLIRAMPSRIRYPRLLPCPSSIPRMTA